MPLPRRSAARGRLAAARIDAIIHALVQDDAICNRSRFWGGCGGRGSRRQLAEIGAGLAGDIAGGEGGGVMLSESAIDAVIDFVDMDETGDIDLKVLLRIYHVYVKFYRYI